MPIKKKLSLLLIVLAACTLFSSFYAYADEINVFVSIVPQKYFVEKIAGDRVNVHVMVQPGASPHTYEPSPGQMRQLSAADAYFSIGVTFEKAWLKKITSANPDLLHIATHTGIDQKPVERSHTHGRHENDHDTLDPHIWLSPPLVMLQARNILDGLVRIDPGGSQAYKANYAAFIAEIVELDMELKKRLKPGMEFMVYHPSWGYFADAYKLKQISIEIDGKTPKAARIKEIIEHARQNNIRVVMVQPQFSTRDAEMISRGIGGRIIKADPLAENWAENLLAVADMIKKQKRP